MIKKATESPVFSLNDFIKLYCAMIFKSGCSPIIEHNELEKRLYRFYFIPEFKELFQDICFKEDYINSENSYLVLDSGFRMAQLYGLLKPKYGVGETMSIISCDEDMAKDIILSTNDEMVDKMSNLIGVMFDLNNLDVKENIHFSDAEFIPETEIKAYKIKEIK